MQEVLLAVVRPGDTPRGYNLTFAFLRGRHQVPGHVAMTSSRWAGAAAAGTVSSGEKVAPASADPQADAGSAGSAGSAEAGSAGSAGSAEAAGQAQPADEGTEDGE